MKQNVDVFDEFLLIERDENQMSKKDRVAAIVPSLLAWFDANARSLPWRQEPTPYHVWISEIMLQQTRVEAVKEYYTRFLEALPEISDLAAVPEESLLKLWEGLGYYSRARNLKKAAIQVMDEYGGELPADAPELLKLPGIGSYTAGAISSIAFRKPYPAVDGNVLRVISRLTGSYEDILKQKTKKDLEELLTLVMPGEQPGAFNQALMEIGALVCIPNGAPHCEECPLRGLCLAKRYGLIDEIPVKTQKKPRKIEKKTVLLITDGEHVMLRRRENSGLLAGLFEFPMAEGHLSEDEIPAKLLEIAGLPKEKIKKIEKISDAKHIFSHVEWHMSGFLVEISEPPIGQIFQKIGYIKEEYALPSAFKKYKDIIFSV